MEGRIKAYTIPQEFKHAGVLLFCTVIYACVSLIILGQPWAFEEKWHKLKDTEIGRLQRAALCLTETLADSQGAQFSLAKTACLEIALLGASATPQSGHTGGTSTNQTLEDARRSDTQISQQEIAKMEELTKELQKEGDELRQSISFLPLKDIKEEGLTDGDRTWFMSSLRRGQSQKGDLEAFYFPSEISKGRLLCVQGRNTGDGTKNGYGFAWKPYLPPNSTLLPGLTLVADSYYDYINPWHSMTALVSLVAWQAENRCVVPDRLVLYQKGNLVTKMGKWITKMLEASAGVHLEPDPLQYEGETVCFEQAVVHRRGIGGMSKEKKKSLFETVRCKVRRFCRVEDAGQLSVTREMVVTVTLLLRSGARAFKNESGVADVIGKACNNATGCKFKVAHIANLSFCEQVEMMSRTDILITTHGAQLTNIMFMSRGRSIMEMFPKGWLEYAGVGQFIYRWLSDWASLHHEGDWRDPDGPDCPYPASERRKCHGLVKDNLVGHDETHLSAWISQVLKRALSRRRNGEDNSSSGSTHCVCEHV